MQRFACSRCMGTDLAAPCWHARALDTCLKCSFGPMLRERLMTRMLTGISSSDLHALLAEDEATRNYRTGVPCNAKRVTFYRAGMPCSAMRVICTRGCALW